MSVSPRYLIVAPSWVGDLVMAQPLLALLKSRTPDCVIDVFAPEWVLPLVKRMPEVSAAIPSPFAHKQVALRLRWQIAKQLRQRAYDAVYVLPNSLKSALVPWLAGIPKRIGYVGESRYGLLNDSRRLDPRKLPRLVDRFLALATADHEAIVKQSSEPRLLIDLASREAVLQRLALRLDLPVACLCPGAEYGPAKRWPTQFFAELARRLMADGMQVWLIGSKRDAEVTAEIKQLGGEAIIDLAGTTQLDEAVDILSCAEIVVSNDSGLMHVAAAAQRRVIALFGSSSPDYTPPLSDFARVVRHPIECSPCFERTCPLGHFNCMMQLRPEIVYREVKRALATAA